MLAHGRASAMLAACLLASRSMFWMTIIVAEPRLLGALMPSATMLRFIPIRQSLPPMRRRAGSLWRWKMRFEEAFRA